MDKAEFEKQAKWFADNIKTATPNEIKQSKEKHCGVPMEEYVGKRFVDWTHRCLICGAMYGCA